MLFKNILLILEKGLHRYKLIVFLYSRKKLHLGDINIYTSIFCIYIYF